MPYTVDFATVSTQGLETSPVADALAGLRANEARYFSTKYGHAFTVEPASKTKALVAYVSRILDQERRCMCCFRLAGEVALNWARRRRSISASHGVAGCFCEGFQAWLDEVLIQMFIWSFGSRSMPTIPRRMAS